MIVQPSAGAFTIEQKIVSLIENPVAARVCKNCYFFKVVGMRAVVVEGQLAVVVAEYPWI